jgi:hypothetical protein
MNLAARFPATERPSDSVEPANGVLSAALWFDLQPRVSLGLTIEHAGLGKERFAIEANGDSLDARYAVDTLWLAGRLYFSDTRPAAYLGAGAGPSVVRVRAQGTRSSATFSVPGEPYQCARFGNPGGGVYVAGGVEAELTEAFLFTAQARVAGHFMSASDDALGSCGPGVGPSVSGAARVGLRYRF